MKILAILVILIFIIMNIKGLSKKGFPEYTSHPGLTIIENINHSGVIAPYGHMFIILILTIALFSLGKAYYIEKYRATEITLGIIKNISFSNVRVNNKPLVDIQVEYLNNDALFKDQPGDFGLSFQVGDSITIKYNKEDPGQAIIPDNAIDLSKE